jgi:hypothetical protein
VIIQICSLFNETDFQMFFNQLQSLLLQLRQSRDFAELAFAMAIQELLPKRSLTIKGINRLRMALLTKLKTFCRDIRKPIDMDEKEFNKTRKVLFFQPERLIDPRFPKRQSMLDTLLTKHPALDVYRVLTLRVGSIYRLPLADISDQLIDGIDIQESWGDRLVTAITTFKKFKPAILRFREFFQNNPSLPKRSRCNTEYVNGPIRRIFASGAYLKNHNRIKNELRVHFSCDVRMIEGVI